MMDETTKISVVRIEMEFHDEDIDEIMGPEYKFLIHRTMNTVYI